VHLRPKTWEVLCLLAANPGRLLTKDDMLDNVWAGSSVSDTMPSISVAELRRALQDDPKRPRYVETVHGRGFRFIAKMTTAGELGEIESPHGDPPRPPHAAAGDGSPFVGRVAELARLEDLIASPNPQCRMILVSGDSGIGKTSLTRRFLDRIESGKANSARRLPIVGWGQCLAHFGEGHPYLPVLGVLRSLCSGRPRVLEHLRETAPSWLARLPDLVTAVELDELRQRTASASPTRVLEEMAAFVRAAGPVVWALEDLHWADEATLDLVAVLAENLSLVDFWVIGTVRLAEAVGMAHPVTRMRRELLRRGRCREILLEGLAERDVVEYLECQMEAGVSYPDWLPRRLLFHSNGNPFLLAHTLEHLRGRGVLPSAAASAEVVAARLEAALDAVPDTLRDVIEDDIGRLTAAERNVLAAASLAGLEVDAAMIAAASGAEVEASDTICADLARRSHFLRRLGETTWPDGTVSGRYAFRHALYQKVLYENLPPSARRASHGRIGRALVVAFGEQANEIATVIADHFERGGDNDQAVTYHLLAARASSERHASREAALHLRCALKLLPHTTNDREAREAEILRELGKVLPALQGFADPGLLALYMRARSLQIKGAPAGDAVTPLIGQLLANLMQRQPYPAEELAREMLEMTASSEEKAPRAHAETLMGAVLYHQGDLAGTIDHADRALALAPESLTFGPMDLRCSALVMSGAALWQAGQPDAGLERALRGLSVTGTSMHPFNRIITLQPLLAIYQWRGDVDAALATARDLAATVREQGILQAEACALLIEAWALFEGGNPTASADGVERGLAALREHGTMMQSVYLLTVAVEVMVGLGRLREASELLGEASALIDAGDARWWEPELRRWRAVLLGLSQPGDAGDEAEACFQASFNLAALQGSASLSLRTANSLAQVRQGQKRHAEARHIIATALHGIHDGADTRDVQEAQRLLSRPSAR